MAKLQSGTRIYGTANVDTSITIGANVQLTTSQLFVGNTTENSTHTASLLQIANSTSTVNVTALGIQSYSNATINAVMTSGLIRVSNSAGNVRITAANVVVQANTTVNSSITSDLVQVSNSTSTANLTALDLKIGATTVVNATQVTATLHVGNVSGSYANITGQVNASSLLLSNSGPAINLTNTTSGWVSFPTGSGISPPTNTTSSVGTKILLYPGVTATQSDFAIGIENFGMWHSVPINTATYQFKWYANTTQLMSLNGIGTLSVNGAVNAASHTVGTAFTANSTVVNAVAYYSGTLLVANSTVSNATHLGGTAASGYQTTAGLSANVATLTANNSTYFGGYTWASPAALGSGTANTGRFTSLTTSSTSLLGGYAQIASYSSMVGVKFPGAGTQYGLALQPAADSTNMITFFNAANTVVGSVTQTATTLTYNGTAAVLSYANVSGQVNAASLLLSTNTATIGTGTYFVSNGNVGIETDSPATKLSVNGTVTATGLSIFSEFNHIKLKTPIDGSEMNFVNYGDGFLSIEAYRPLGLGDITLFANSTFIHGDLLVGSKVSVNGSYGTTGQVITSGGSGATAYWSTISAGGGGSTYMKGGSATVGSLATEGQNIFRVNANTINFDTTIAAGENAQATGPIVIASGKTLTVETNGRVSIV